jgi:hypothetical protein
MANIITNLNNLVDESIDGIVSSNVSVVAAQQAIVDAQEALTLAQTALSEAQTAVTEAQTAEINAEGHATDASAYATTAATKANESAQSAVGAAAQVALAQAKVDAAQAFADQAEASKIATEGIQTDVNNTAAVIQADIDVVDSVRAEAEAIQVEVTELLAASRELYDHYDDRYLGGHSDDPPLDNDGDDVVDGALYWNTSLKEIRVFDQVNLMWKPISAASGALLATQNLGDLPNTTEARDNLDVYSKAEISAVISAELANADTDLGAQVTGVLI